MILPDELSDAQHAALVECLRLLAALGEQADENENRPAAGGQAGDSQDAHGAAFSVRRIKPYASTL